MRDRLGLQPQFPRGFTGAIRVPCQSGVTSGDFPQAMSKFRAQKLGSKKNPETRRDTNPSQPGRKCQRDETMPPGQRCPRKLSSPTARALGEDRIGDQFAAANLRLGVPDFFHNFVPTWVFTARHRFKFCDWPPIACHQNSRAALQFIQHALGLLIQICLAVIVCTSKR